MPPATPRRADRPRAARTLFSVLVTACTVPLAGTVPASGAVRPATTTSPDCGPTLHKADGSVWTCTFDDEFSGSSLDRTQWDVETTASNGFHSGAECFVDSPSSVSVANGYLKLSVRAAPGPFTCTSPLGDYTTSWTSGMVYTGAHFDQAYGRFSVRARVTPVTTPGVQSSYWLWPLDPQRYGSVWPDSGEIDIAELYSSHADRAVPYVHYVTATDQNVTNTDCVVGDTSTFHTYTLIWTPTSLTFRYDGTDCLVDHPQPSTLTAPAPFDAPFMVILTEALGIGGNAFDAATTPLPASTQIDWVRVWK